MIEYWKEEKERAEREKRVKGNDDEAVAYWNRRIKYCEKCEKEQI